MKATKAIEILNSTAKQSSFMVTEDERDAIKLGIEALKAIEHQRTQHHYYVPKLLPGETEKTPADTSFRHSTANHRLKENN